MAARFRRHPHLADGAQSRGLSGGQHQAGTARMSDSPRHGATDPDGKLWGTDRVYIADASLHVTNGGANPVLTIMALAWRTAPPRRQRRLTGKGEPRRSGHHGAF
ncbi:GMC oxidoreductase [Spirillospora sp. CA-255316]